ncbi:hypothetical protein TNCT1_05200 [Streptomyces sp. 1-11]|nr:hypothetical protein TNCT1_05200 [Streptomyces sp. 1-11]
MRTDRMVVPSPGLPAKALPLAQHKIGHSPGGAAHLITPVSAGGRAIGPNERELTEALFPPNSTASPQGAASGFRGGRGPPDQARVAASSITVTSEGASTRVGGPQAPAPRLT